MQWSDLGELWLRSPDLTPFALFVFVLFVFNGGRARKRDQQLGRCPWQMDPKRRSHSLKKFTCARCGQDGFSLTSRPPMTCMRSFGRSQLI